MNKEQILNKIEEKDDNVVSFEDEKAKLSASPKAGMEPPDGYNWLNDLPEGAIFFTRPKFGGDSRALDLSKFLLIKKFEKVSILRQEMPNRQVLEIPMHTADFSAKMTCVEVPIILDLEEQEAPHAEGHPDVQENQTTES